MERKIGEVFEYQGKKLRVQYVPEENCKGCFFDGCCTRGAKSVTGYCDEENRTDGSFVIFTEVKDEPTEQPEERPDLLAILKYCPEGTEFWSPMLGYVKFICLGESTFPVEDKNGRSWDINRDSTMTIDGITSAEPMLFPSKEQRDWSKWKCPKPKFDPKTLQPFDKVLTRIGDGDVYCWSADFVSMPCEDSLPCTMKDNDASMIIPYNDDTKHLVGTTDEAPDFYKYWED